MDGCKSGAALRKIKRGRKHIFFDAREHLQIITNDGGDVNVRKYKRGSFVVRCSELPRLQFTFTAVDRPAQYFPTRLGELTFHLVKERPLAVTSIGVN
jgi:hypothetical protein